MRNFLILLRLIRDYLPAQSLVQESMRAFNASIPRPALNFALSNYRQAEFLDLEIGAGQGLHAVKHCQANPRRVLLAVEKTHSRYAKLAGRRLKHPELDNLSVIHADAEAFVTHYLEAGVLDQVFLLYPNPYPKAKQANRRWHNRPFFAQLLKAMKPHARLILATNSAEYANEAEAQMQMLWHLKLIAREAVDPTLPPRTHFEKKYLTRGETCWNLMFCKSADIGVQ